MSKAGGRGSEPLPFPADQTAGRLAARRSDCVTRPAASSLRAIVDDTAPETPGALRITMSA